MGIADIARKTERALVRFGTQRKAAQGWRPSIIGYYGFGDSTQVRVLGRVVMADPNAPAPTPANAKSQRGFRQFFTLQVPNHEVTVRVGEQAVETRTNENGYIDVLITDHGLEPGWQEVTIEARGADPIQAQVQIVAPGTTIGLVSDIDDTVLVTWLPRAMIAAYNSWYLPTDMRKPVPGMAEFYQELLRKHPDAPVFYLSTGAWNTFYSLTLFLAKHGFPKGPLLLTDWGPTPTGLFRNGVEHKRVQLRNLIIDFPDINWILVGDDGQHDPLIFGNIAGEHPDRLAGIALRNLSPQEHVLSHGSATPIDPANMAQRNDVPYVQGSDGFELLAEYQQYPFPREVTADMPADVAAEVAADAAADD